MLLISFALRAFQSTLPHGSDPCSSSITTSLPISIHAPSRERLIHIRLLAGCRDFNPRSLTGATTRSRAGLNGFLTFQSTLPHGSDRVMAACRIHDVVISIHAPSRERLSTTFSKFFRFQISIHAPSRERPMFCSAYAGCF